MGCCPFKPSKPPEVVPEMKPNGTQMPVTESPSSAPPPSEVPGKITGPDKPVKFNEKPKDPSSSPPEDTLPPYPPGLPPKPPEQKGGSPADGGHLNETNQVAPPTNTSVPPQSPKMTKDASSSYPLGFPPKPPDQKGSSLADGGHLNETNQVAPTTNTSPPVPPQSPKMTKDASSSYSLGLPPKPLEQKGSSLVDGGHLNETKQVAPTSNNTTYSYPPAPPQSPKMNDASSSYPFGLPPISQEPKSVGVTEERSLAAHPGVPDYENLNQTKKGAPTTNNPTSSSHYAPPGSAKFAKDIDLTSQGNLIPPQKTDSSFDLTPQRPSTPPKPPEVRTILPRDNFGYPNPTDTRSTPTSSDMTSSYASVPWTTPKAKESDHEEADRISNLRKIAQSMPSQNIGNVASKHAPPRHPAPEMAPAGKKIPREGRGNQKELERHNSNDYGEDGFSYQ